MDDAEEEIRSAEKAGIRYKNRPMTTKPDPQVVVRALELASQVQHMDGVLSCSNIRKECKAALPLARLMAEQWDGGEAKAALKWMRDKFTHLFEIYLKEHADCHAIIKRYLGEKV